MELTEAASELWRRAIGAPHRLLALDYDGTLAAFHIDRLRATMEAGAQEALRRIAGRGRTTIAIVSGRPVAELIELVPIPSACLVGEHGWELAVPGEGVHQHPLASAAAEDVARAWSEGRLQGWAQRVERKRTGTVLHFRGLPRPEAEALRAAAAQAWGPIAAAGAVRLVDTDGGLELRAAGRDKGTAVRELLADLPAGTLPVVLGDDATDEDAFRAVAGIGFAIRVGEAAITVPVDIRLASPGEVVTFLRLWLEQVEKTS
jgi:trehalose-phosphatase